MQKLIIPIKAYLTMILARKLTGLCLDLYKNRYIKKKLERFLESYKSIFIL